MKITITTPKEIEEFLTAQCKLLREDRLPISVLLKPADDSCWRDGKQVSDAHGEAFGPLFLGAMLSRASLKLRAEDRYPADSELEVSFGLSLFANNESIMVYPSCIDRITTATEDRSLSACSATCERPLEWTCSIGQVRPTQGDSPRD